MSQIAIIGGGPAGLRAAEVASQRGSDVTIYDAKPSVGRKLLVAGRGGLNLTKDEAFDRFVTNFHGEQLPREDWVKWLKAFDSDALRAWAAGLGIETFSASTGRVYPREMKAAPLLRRWVERLRSRGVKFMMRHCWTGIHCGERLRLEFDSQAGAIFKEADAVVLAMGGGSWPETGSDGGWIGTLEQCGVSVSPLQPANCGWEVEWPPEVLQAAEGLPLKNIVASVGEIQAAGELILTKYGLEGGAVYQLGPALRLENKPVLTLDFKPGVSMDQLVKKMGPITRNFLPEARQRWKLSDAAFAILSHHEDRTVWNSTIALAAAIKACPIRLRGPRPIAEAISSAGGVRWTEIDENLMLRSLPGVFLAGEMVDWEAPTGGYLMQGCFATGTWAGLAAEKWTRHE